MNRRRIALMIFAGLSCATAAKAQVPVGGPDATYVATQPSTAQQPQLLMDLLDRAGVGHALEDAHVRVFGHIEGSYTHNFDDPAQDLNLGRVFDLKNDRPTLNQIDLNVERPVELTFQTWDVGGRLEMLYGSDARFIHSSGLFDHDDFFHGPEYQFDLPQIYVDVAVPVGNGLRIRAGKFLFFKQIDPNASVFYSHSFSFGAALPFTLTGVTGFYRFNRQLSLEAGLTLPWDQTLIDRNGDLNVLARLRYDVNDRLGLTLAAIVGPDLPHDSHDYRETVDFTASYAATDQLTLMLDVVFGTQARSGTGAANWYGASVYAIYRINDYLSLGGRAEWYRDEEGFTTAVAQSLFEGTVGVTVTPFPHDPVGANFKLRPEVRGDYSTRPFFSGVTRHDQWTIALDAIFNF